MSNVLFVTWDGPDQNYLESLFFPIFSRAARAGLRFEVLQFRWGSPEQRKQVAQAALALGIGYRSVEIARRPKAVGAVATAAHGAWRLRRELRGDFDLVMPRSILPALAVNLVRPAQPVVFDADGLPADERVEFGGWHSSGTFYRSWRAIEVESVRRAASVVVRTAAARDVLIARGGPALNPDAIFVAPNGKDETIFTLLSGEERQDVRRRAGIPEAAPWLVFVGSVGAQYCAAETLAFFQRVLVLAPGARLTILTGQLDEMRAIIERHAFPPGAIQTARLPPNEVPAYLAAADLGLALRVASFSQRAVSPIKVSEYLLCGLPVLTTRNVGDLDAQLGQGGGKLLADLGSESLAEAAHWFVERLLPEREAWRTRCRQVGLRHFSLDACAERYVSACNFALGRAS